MHDLILQEGAALDGHAQDLFLLFHGVGADAQDLRPIGEGLAARHPGAWVVSVQAPFASDLGRGWQWFSVQGVTPTNRAARIAAALPAFEAAVTGWQTRSGVTAAHTTLVGFSQGAIMALAATQGPGPRAGRVAAMAGRLAMAPTHAADGTRIHLLHGSADPVVPMQASVEAHAQLKALGADVTLDLVPGLGHGIDARMATLLHQRLETASGTLDVGAGRSVIVAGEDVLLDTRLAP